MLVDMARKFIENTFAIVSMQLVLEHQKGYFGFRRGHLIRFRNGVTVKARVPKREVVSEHAGRW